MISFSRFTLANGMRVIVHYDSSTPLVAMNLLYDTGSKDEDPSKTGMAHLFEHLMFCGSANIPEYDLPLQLAGGENNAFTNNDITDYYLTVPAGNIETAFWLESDRMLQPAFTPEKLEIQKSVVIEEFRQRYLNQPYGDSMHLIRPLAYKVHPYRWPTIGMDPSHVAGVTMEDALIFFRTYYSSRRAVLALAGNISPDKAYSLAEKWFGPVNGDVLFTRDLPQEHEQNGARDLYVERNVPADALYKVWHIGRRADSDYYTLDLLTDLLAGGDSGRLYNRLVRELRMFSEINAYITADIEPGLLIMTGKIMKGTEINKAENALNEVIDNLKHLEPAEDEMEKVRNKFESATVLSNTSIMNKALNLSINELLGDPGLINTEVERFRAVTGYMVSEAAGRYLDPGNCTTLYYKSSGKK
ncbi:MAG: pitrilysin family protein [Bacteroidales bacterium]|jgi:predicted Zn-dependent peptidase|nr:pitrilysin family protein [Bacteroidales bacterium]